jgi:hypothetical protein
MIIRIDVNQLIESNLSADEFLALALIAQGGEEYLGMINAKALKINTLVDEDYIDDNLDITSKGLSTLSPAYDDIQTIAQVMVGMWAKYPGKMSPEAHVKNLLEWYVRENPEVNGDTILEASRKYLDSVTDSRYIKRLSRFIRETDGISTDYDSMLVGWVYTVQQEFRNGDSSRRNDFETQV